MLIIIIGLVMSLFASDLWMPAGPILIAICILITFFPLEGFKPRTCKEITLIKLRRTGRTKDSIFIEKKGKKVIYAYDNREKYDVDGVAYEETFVKGNIKIYEVENCKTPCLKIFKTRPIRELVATAPFATRIEYVFIIPTSNSVSEEKPVTSTQDIFSCIDL